MKKKNTKIADLKKLAVLGLTAGILVPSEGLMANNAQFSETNFDHYLAGGGCGHNSYPSYYPQQHSCQSQGWAQSGCSNYQPQSGCAHSYQPQYWQQAYQPQPNWQAQSGCGSYQPQQLHQPQQHWQAQSSCANQHPGNAYADNSDQNQNSMQSIPQDPQNNNSRNYRSNYAIAEADQPTSTRTAPLTEKELMNNLNSQSKATFQSLSPEGKALALKLANQDCKGKNSCKGLNVCANPPKNDCAGKSGCKGQSKCNFKDKNVAVKVAAQKMAEKRNGMLNR